MHAVSGAYCVCALTLFAAEGANAQAKPFAKLYTFPATTVTLPASALKLDLNGAGPTEFARVQQILARGDKGFVVANGATNELRFFDANGKFVKSSGRKGGGPGEYQRFISIALMPGDTIAVLDDIARRLSLVSPDGTYLRSVPLSPSPNGLGGPARVVALHNGKLLVAFNEVISMAPRETPVYFAEQFFEVNTSSGVLSKTELRLQSSEHFVQASLPKYGGVAYWDLAFGRAISIRPTPRALVTGDGTAWAVEERSVTGAVVGTHSLTRQVDVITGADKQQYRMSVLRGRKGEDSVLTERMAAEMPYPRTKPAYSRIEVDNEAHIWLQPYSAAQELPSAWIRLNPRTNTAISLAMPPRFRPIAFTTQLVFGVWRDADDVEHVQAYALPTFR